MYEAITQYRRVIGNHVNGSDKQQGSQKKQNERIHQLAAQPGSHAGNRDRQQIAHATVQLLSVLSSVQNTHTSPAITSRRAEELAVKAHITYADNLHLGRAKRAALQETMIKSRPENTQKPQDRLPEEHRATFPTNYPFKKPIQSVSGEFSAATSASAPGKDADEKTTLINVVNDATALNIDYDNAGELGFHGNGKKTLEKFYENYKSITPDFKHLSNDILRKKIKKRFNLDIDPDKFDFIRFESVLYDGGEKKQFTPQTKETLTECLFTNFSANIQDNLVDMDAMCGIYSSSLENNVAYNAGDALNIKPTQFIQLVWDIDFYSYARKRTIDLLDNNKGTHIKKYFIDAINDLNISGIKSTFANDVLRGIGVLKNTNISATLFDIDGYNAANAFVIKNNEDGHVTLYFPQSDFKFISFRGGFEMRSWVTNACDTKEHRDMIASHFTIANKQDGIFYYGIDAWLKSIHENNDYSNRIAMKSTPVSSEHFFDDLHEQIKDKVLSDLDSLVKSDSEVRRDMWEEMIDASNILPNPVSPFLSLGIHLEHMIEADSYDEKQNEWTKIKYDAINLVTMVLMDKAMQFPDVDGYVFIEKVKSGVENEDIKHTGQLNEKKTNVVGNNAEEERDITYQNINEDNMEYDEQNGCFRVKRGAVVGRLCSSVASASQMNVEWRDPGMNLGVDLSILDGYTSRAIPAEKISPLQHLKGNIYRGYDDGVLYLKYKNSYFKLERNGEHKLSIIIRNAQDTAGGSRNLGEKKLVDIYHNNLNIQDTVPLEGTEAYTASKHLGTYRSFETSSTFNEMMEGNLDKGLLVINEKDIFPVKGLQGIFLRRNTGEYYIRYKDRFFRMAFDHSKKTLSIFSKKIKQEQLISNLLCDQYNIIYPATDTGMHDMKVNDAMRSLNIRRIPAEFFIDNKMPTNLAIDEQDSIRSYGRTESFAINNFLSAGMPEPYINEWIREVLVENISLIRSGLKKIPPYEGVVFRGTGLDGATYDSLSPGCIVSNKAFMSSTVDPALAQSFSYGRHPVLLEIKIKESGHPISTITGKHSEAEVLIEDHKYFRVNNIDRSSRRIELEEIPDSSLNQAEQESVIVF